MVGLPVPEPKWVQNLLNLRAFRARFQTAGIQKRLKRVKFTPSETPAAWIRTYCLTNVTLLLDLSKSTRTTSSEATLPDKISLASGVSISV